MATDLLQHSLKESIGNTDNRHCRLSVPAGKPGISADQLRIGGFIPTTTIDFPNHLAAVIFTQGCPWRCPYCHNSHLARQEQSDKFNWNEIYALLERRKHLLDGVVFSGGEPTVQKALSSAMSAVSDLGMKIALHSGGPVPDRFKQAIQKTNWVGFDIKGMPDQYPDITGDERSGINAWKSLRILLDSGVPHEIRTTIHWNLFTTEKIEQLARALRNVGVKNYIIQLANSEHMLNMTLGTSSTTQDLTPLWDTLRSMFDHFEVRQ